MFHGCCLCVSNKGHRLKIEGERGRWGDGEMGGWGDDGLLTIRLLNS
ncbi:MAG: hypothetical protein F6K58_13635 [Symploca sp. SIO2E9]|nr:hypothetical protein [Symploca sp. SIO2E9]